MALDLSIDKDFSITVTTLYQNKEARRASSAVEKGPFYQLLPWWTKLTGHLDYADVEDWHHIASLAKAKKLAICPRLIARCLKGVVCLSCEIQLSDVPSPDAFSSLISLYTW